MARRSSVVNQKGGVGKTSTAINVAVAITRRGSTGPPGQSPFAIAIRGAGEA